MIVQVSCPEQLVNKTVWVDPGHLHTPGGLCATIVGDAAARRDRLLITPLKSSLAAIQRTGLHATEYRRRLGCRYRRATRRQTKKNMWKQINKKYMKTNTVYESA